MSGTFKRRATSAVFAVAIATHATAFAQRLPDLPIEDLLGIDAGSVFGASERIQPVTEAPASVSFITAENIERYGYKTLADILHGVRGMYVSDDRNFSLLGARGFGKPGDYNSRILLLVNGHRVNDNIFGQAEIGAEFGLDPAMFERVEIIRGPASSLYGDSAFFAVVNVITRTGDAIDGTSVTYETGSYGENLVRGTTGQRLANGVDYAVSATLGHSDGVDSLYFPEWNTPQTNFGVANGLDGQHVGQYYGRLAVGSFTFTGAYGRRRKDIPTASFGSLFNEQSEPQHTIDRHTLLDLEYARPLGTSRVSMRGSYDRFTADGYYPYPGELFGRPMALAFNDVVGARWTAGGHITQPLPHQVLILGAEFINNVQQDQRSGYVDPSAVLLDINQSSTQAAIYAQNEVKIGRRLILNGGLRYDAYQRFGRITPRTAVIVMPDAHQSFKYLFGNAFRAPNGYERNDFYFGPNVLNLDPESIDTHELVWERYTSDWLRTSVSGYWYTAHRLITLVPDPDAFFGITYVNEGEVRASGMEFEAQMRLPRGAEAHMSYALQKATDRQSGLELTNSPRQMIKGRISAPLFGRNSSLALEVLGIGSRLTRSRSRLDANTTANVTLIKPITPSLALVGTVRNVLDVEYADPASDQHLQETIPRNGRTFTIGLRVKFPM